MSNFVGWDILELGAVKIPYYFFVQTSNILVAKIITFFALNSSQSVKVYYNDLKESSKYAVIVLSKIVRHTEIA